MLCRFPGSKHQEEEYLGSDSAAHQQPAGATESTDVRPPEAEGEGEGEGGPSRGGELVGEHRASSAGSCACTLIDQRRLAKVDLWSSRLLNEW